MKQIIFGSDHAGFELKTKLVAMLKSDPVFRDFEILDEGCFTSESVDYPDIANLVCTKLQEQSFGILVCGSGQGMCMRANKYSNIRAALVYNTEIAKLSREHNDANTICFGARFIDFDTAAECLKLFLNTPFAQGRHKVRVDKLSTKAL